MKPLVYLLLGLFLLGCQASPPTEITETNFSQYVNPFIGTGGHGHTYPGASRPFGFVQLSPDSRLDGWDGCGGYHYSDSVIYGFSHTHLSGTGVSDYGDLLLMPLSKFQFDNGYQLHPDSGYGSSFSHENEKATAGYYSVYLEVPKVKVELTSTERAGFHHYHYKNQGIDPLLIIDLRHRDELLDYQLQIVNDSTLSGKRISKAWALNQAVYFHIKFSQSINSFRYNTDSSKLILQFKDHELYTKVGLSAVSIEGAKENLKLEIPHWNFEAIKTESRQHWNAELSKIKVELLHDSDKTIFYTALYHSFLSPNLFQDVTSHYRGTDHGIHRTRSQFINYTVFSLWDTYRATHPLFTLTQRERSRDFIHTFLNQYKNGGKLPVWELAGNYTGCMIGYHAVPVIVDAYFKGIRDFDHQLALEAMLASANAHELGKKEFAQNGFIAMDEEHESVSKTLEYAFDDWCIAQFAKAIGNDSVYREFIMRSQFYKNCFDPASKFMRAKRNQQFTEPFDPTEVNFNYTEANAWQYSFYVPQDIEGLIKLHGGEAKFEQMLDSLFQASEQTTGRHQVDITGLIGQYAHGNEPSHHMAYLYNYIGKERKTQEKVRTLLTKMYTTQADGLIGNEDCGQMSSWYVFSAVGFYPVTPGSTHYIIGSPLVKKAVFELENGKTFQIEALNNSTKSTYIQKVELNGKPYTKSYLDHSTILKGGKMVFYMGETPQTDYFKQSPLSQIDGLIISPTPFVNAESQVFQDSLEITLQCIDSSASIEFKLHESEAFQTYTAPFMIKESTALYMRSKSPQAKNPSATLKANFYRLKNNKKVTYETPYNPQYSAGGKKGLVDYIRGGEDFRTGLWQGFQGNDVVITIELDSLRKIRHLSAGFLQDINSWIWMPRNVRYSYSTDGIEYFELGLLKNQTPTDEYGVFLKEVKLDFSTVEAKYIRLEAQQYGTIPEWHLGKGGESFIFIDEVLIQ
ncbi:MAG: GH92 family glycosyl hydrolase [Vicingaceae bacterium]